MPFDAADVGAFFDADMPGYVSATYNATTTVGGLFGNDYFETSNVQGTKPFFVCASSAVSAAAHGDTLLIGSTTYKVVEVDSDSVVGKTMLILEKQ